MTRPTNIETLEARKTELLRQLKQIEQAIKTAKEKEQRKKERAVLDALYAQGLLGGDLNLLLAKITEIGTVPTAKLDKRKPATLANGEVDALISEVE